MMQGGKAMVGGTALVALSLVLAPAFAASLQPKAKKKPAAPALAVGGFTPAVADPRLAALFANRGLSGGSFHFTPSATPNGSKAVKVAVRARAATPAAALRGGSESAAVAGLTPTAYNLGVAVGWKQFALSGDVAKVDGGLLPGGREAAEVGLSYAGKKFTGRLQVGAERSDGRQLRVLPQESAYSVDLGGSYSIARNVDLTGGVRYRIEHDRLERLDDQRRDSQAVYIGTAFRF